MPGIEQAAWGDGMKSRAADIDFAWLVERYRELYANDKDQSQVPERRREKRAYLKGRIDEFCTQNAIDREDRRLASREAEGVPA